MNDTVKKILAGFAILLGLLVILFAMAFFRIKSETSTMTPLATRQVMPDIFAVRDGTVNIYLVKTAKGYIAVDGGDNAGTIKAGLAKLRIDPSEVTAVFLTHSDFDHQASLPLFKNAKVFISKDEEQMVNGKTARMLFIKNSLHRAHETLADGQSVTVDGVKIQGIATPGHTPGAMSYLVNDSWLFTGDALRLKKGAALPFYGLFTMDTPTMKKSLGKLAALKNIKKVFTAHNGSTDEFEKAFAAWKKP